MTFLKINLIIVTLVNISSLPTINSIAPFQVRKIGTNTNSGKTTDSSDSTVVIQNESKGEILATVGYIQGIPRMQAVHLKPSEVYKFFIPRLAKNMAIKIEKWNLWKPNLSVWPPPPPVKQVLLRESLNFSKMNEKCYAVTGTENNMKASVKPCKS